MFANSCNTFLLVLWLSTEQNVLWYTWKWHASEEEGHTKTTRQTFHSKCLGFSLSNSNPWKELNQTNTLRNRWDAIRKAEWGCLLFHLTQALWLGQLSESQRQPGKPPALICEGARFVSHGIHIGRLVKPLTFNTILYIILLQRHGKKSKLLIIQDKIVTWLLLILHLNKLCHRGKKR